jgi:predicted ATPase/DNA-binding SARP family transcriptional activator
MARLGLSLLGSLQISLDGRPVSGIAYNKARALLAYLAVEAERVHHRDALVGLLWPELPDTAARANLRVALANLREAIGDVSATPPFLLITRDTIQLNPASDYDLDMASFAALLTTCETHAHRHLERCHSCAARMEQAIALYGGDFPAGFGVGDSAPFEEWQLRQRERLHQQVLDILARLADYHERRGDDERARHAATRQIELEPWREEAHRQLMRLLARGHQRSAALAQYETCRRILARDLGVELEAETTALYERIRDSSGAEVPAPKGITQRTLNLRNFPAQTSLLIGRETELAELGALLGNPAHRLITIVGPGGIGKTRLALAAAAEQAEAFTHGAVFVPLQAISSTAFLAPAILSALDIPLQGQRDPREQLLDELRDQELLLLLDNFEQLLTPDLVEDEGGAALLMDMLQRAPGITLLVTSRERLALQGEWLVEVSGLSYPIDELAEGLEAYSAVQLFVQRARQMRRQFALADGDVRAVTRICQLVEGLPLAIELAAAALRGRSCTAIADAIATSLSALATGLRAVPERHRSIQATFEHSWYLLSDEERQAFPKLSVFRGGFDEEAAVQVARATVELLAALVDKSLLRWDGAARYDIHELVRQYAGEKLEQAGETETIRRRHAEYFLALAEAAEPHLTAMLHGPDQVSWLARLSAEHDNLRTALAWSLARTGDRQLGLQLAGTLNFYWMYRGHIREGSGWLVALLPYEADHAATPRKMPLRVRAKALMAAGNLAEQHGRLVEARALLEESTKLYVDLGEARDAAWSQWFLAHLYWTQGAHERAAQLCEDSLQGYRAAGDMSGVNHCLWLLSNIAREQGDLQRALMLAETAHTHAQELRNPISVAYTLFSISRVRLATGDIEVARSATEQALALGQQLGHRGLIAHVLLQLGRVVQAEGDGHRAAVLWEQAHSEARDVQHLRAMAEVLLELGWLEHRQGNEGRALALLTESLELYRDRGHRVFIVECLAAIAGVHQAKARTAADAFRVVRLYGAAQSGYVANPALLYHRERMGYACDLAAMRSKLDEATFAAAWAEGQAMTLEQAIACALEGSEIDSVPPPEPPQHHNNRRPHLAITVHLFHPSRPVLDRLGQVRRADVRHPRQVGDGAGQLEHALLLVDRLEQVGLEHLAETIVTSLAPQNIWPGHAKEIVAADHTARPRP